MDGGLVIAAYVGYPDTFSEKGGPRRTDDVLVCLLDHHAFVFTKVREYLKRRAGTVNQGGSTAAVMNEGHREAWVRELSGLDTHMGRRPDAVNGLRLLDAASPVRADATTPAESGGGEAADVILGELLEEEEELEVSGGTAVASWKGATCSIM